MVYNVRKAEAMLLHKADCFMGYFSVIEENADKIDDLCKRAKINYKDNNFYDSDGNIITRDAMIDLIVNDLCASAKIFLESDEDKLYHANMVKSILKNNVMTKLQKSDENIITVEELMAKLYDHNAEKGSRNK